MSLAFAGDTRVMVIHDVIRDFAAARLGTAGQLAAHQALLASARKLAGLATRDRPGLDIEGGTQWWRLPAVPETGYLWQNLTYHLKAAGLERELDEVCLDLRFAAVRLSRSGPSAVEADLAWSAAPAAARLRRAISQSAHLLGPIDPPAALTTTLTSRLGGVPGVAGQLPAVREGLRAWTAWSEWPVPDQSSALIRVLVGHEREASAVAISPDGTWIASADSHGTVRTWDADGTARAVLAGHKGRVNAVAIAPDGTWIASAGDRTVRTWDADGTARAVLIGHEEWVHAVAISPDGTWIASASEDGTVRTWDADGTHRAVRADHRLPVHAVAIAPDGTWIATVGKDGTVRTWDADGTHRAVRADHRLPAHAVAIAPDGTWIASAANDGLRTWDADGTARAVLACHEGAVVAVAIAPDGTWIASAGEDGTVRTWDADGTARAVLTGHASAVVAVAIAPDGTWIASAGRDRTVRIWDSDSTSAKASSATAVRVDSSLSACAWLPGTTRLCFAGQKGVYLYSLCPPPA